MQWWMVRRRVDTSWLIALLSSGIIIGVVTAQYAPSDMFGSAAWVIAALLLIAFGLWRQKIYVIVPLVMAGIMIGLWRGGLLQTELSPYKNLTGHMVTIEGRVSEDPELDKKNMLVIRLDVQAIDGHDMAGMVWLTTHEKMDIRRGDILTAKGSLATGFGGFAATMYRAEISSVQRPVPGDIAARVREWFSQQVRAVIPDPQSALGIGFLTGQRQSLPIELDEAMKVAGLTHIVVASGYNLTILVRLARRLFVKVSKYLAALSSMLMIGSFIAITGASPSMSRAGLVSGLSLAAWYYGRKFHPLVLLPFVAAITLLVNPSYGWNDLGWQLSFAAFAGVMIMAPLFQAYFFGTKEPGMVRQVAGETIAAQLATLPILIVAFGQVSNAALITNLLVVPLVPLAMLLTFSAGIVFAMIPFLATVIGWCANLVLTYMITIVHFFAALPWAVSELSVPWFTGIGMYAVMIGWCWYMWHKTKYNLRSSSMVE